MVARLAKEVMSLDTEIAETETMIEERFRRHRHAEIILSMPGFGVILGAEFITATGGNINTFASVDRLAGVLRRLDNVIENLLTRRQPDVTINPTRTRYLPDP